jgi:uncharacterized protein (DUF1778 family)
MKTNQAKKARLNIDCSLEERRLIRTLAVNADKSVPQFILGLIRKEFQNQGIDISQIEMSTTTTTQ